MQLNSQILLRIFRRRLKTKNNKSINNCWHVCKDNMRCVVWWSVQIQCLERTCILQLLLFLPRANGTRVEHIEFFNETELRKKTRNEMKFKWIFKSYISRLCPVSEQTGRLLREFWMGCTARYLLVYRETLSTFNRLYKYLLYVRTEKPNDNKQKSYQNLVISKRE